MAAFFGGLGVLGPLAGTADMIATTGFLAAAGAGGSSAMGFGTAAASSASDDRINVYGARLYVSEASANITAV